MTSYPQYKYTTLDNLELSVDELELTGDDWESIEAMELEFSEDVDLILFLIDAAEEWNLSHPNESKTAYELLTNVAINEYVALARRSSRYDY